MFPLAPHFVPYVLPNIVPSKPISHSTLATYTLIILFSENLEISQKFEKKKFVKENIESPRIFHLSK